MNEKRSASGKMTARGAPQTSSKQFSTSADNFSALQNEHPVPKVQAKVKTVIIIVGSTKSSKDKAD